MTFYQRGELDLDMPVSDPYLLGPDYAANGKVSHVFTCAHCSSMPLRRSNAGFSHSAKPTAAQLRPTSRPDSVTIAHNQTSLLHVRQVHPGSMSSLDRYWYYTPEFGCAGSDKYDPPESFDCQPRIYQAVLNQTLINPVGAVYLYSDISMITMMFVVGTLARDLGYVTVNEVPLIDV